MPCGEVVGKGLTPSHLCVSSPVYFLSHALKGWVTCVFSVTHNDWYFFSSKASLLLIKLSAIESHLPLQLHQSYLVGWILECWTLELLHSHVVPARKCLSFHTESLTEGMDTLYGIEKWVLCPFPLNTFWNAGSRRTFWRSGPSCSIPRLASWLCLRWRICRIVCTDSFPPFCISVALLSVPFFVDCEDSFSAVRCSLVRNHCLKRLNCEPSFYSVFEENGMEFDAPYHSFQPVMLASYHIII
mgnify:FL=1